LADVLAAEDEPEDLQNTIYQIAKKNNVQPKDFFKILYQIILSTTRGPNRSVYCRYWQKKSRSDIIQLSIME